MPNSNSDLDTILKQLDKEAFLNSLGLQKNRNGRWYVDCPFCGGKEKLSINVDNGLWKCFKDNCPGGQGNIITLYAKMQDCTNGEAVKAIKEFAGIEDESKFGQSSKSKKTIKKTVSPKVNDIPDADQTGGDDIPPWEDPVSTEEGTHLPDKYVESAINAETALSQNIYSELVKLAHLTDAHRNELRTKRGFTDDTIERLSFRSGGPYMVQIIETLKGKFTAEDLRKAGILFEVNGKLVPNKQLIDPVIKLTKDGKEKTHSNILIPYPDEYGRFVYLRSHKLGFKNVPIQIYCRMFLAEARAAGFDWTFITEGEFKAGALRQLKFPSFAIPGVGSFSDTRFDELVSLLKEFGIKKVIWLFDNEIKDNPDFDNYKQKPEKRYDTEFYSYIMAYKFHKAGFVSLIGKLPDEWRQKGKIDCDGAVALGKKHDDFLPIINKAKTHNEFINQLPDDAQRIVKRKNAKYFLETKSPITREFNKYVITHKKGEENEWEETISNFIINIKSSFFTPDGVIRNIQLVNEFGETSATFAMTPGNMAGLHEFKQFCFSKGNYLFKGSSDDLLKIWEFEFARDVGDLIYMPEGIGRVDNDVWLFANAAIHEGKIYRPDSDGIMWINGKGYKPQSIQINAHGESTNESIPALSEKPIDLADLARKMRQTVGGYEAYMGLGWVIATLFNDDIFDVYKCCPIFFPHGKRGSGKSTFARWLIRCFGIELEGTGLADTTAPYISRAVSFYSSLGVPFEEYRNEQKVKQKDGLFRGLYNRQFSGKGTNTSIYTRAFNVNANILIVGEELPGDNGLFTRLIPVQISEHKRDRTHYEYLNRHMTSFSYLTYYVIMNFTELKPKIMANIAELKQMLLSRDISDRTAENWAICAGAFYTVILQDDEFIRWVEKACQEIKQTGEKEHMLNQFFHGVSVLVNEHKLNSSHICFDRSKNYIAIWTGVYDIWSEHYRKVTGNDPFDELSIRKYLMDEPYYLKTEKITFFGKERKRAFVINLSKAPEELHDVIDIMEARQWQQESG
jgi:DNA primase